MSGTCNRASGSRTLAAAGRTALAAVAAAAFAIARTRAAHADTLVVIGAGDTLSGVAAAHGTTVEAIVARNGLASADRVFAGQRLLVPGDAPTSVAQDAPARPSPREAHGAPGGAHGTSADADVFHTVAPGETLFAIAMRYRTTVRAIARANGLGRSDFVRAGRRLVVPDATVGAVGGASAAGTDDTSSEGADGDDGAGGDVDIDDIDEDGDGGAGGDGDGGVEDVDASGADASAYGGARRIVVDLSDQTLSAYAGGRRVNRFIVSSGAAWTPTPLGTYAVYARYDRQRMTGPGYDLPNVPFVQYFTGSYAIHGAYWHQQFGVPVSHGCVNLQPGDAAWLWDWAAIGTPVVVQP